MQLNDRFVLAMQLMMQCIVIFVALFFWQRAKSHADEQQEQADAQYDDHSPTHEAKATSSFAAKACADDQHAQDNVQCDCHSPTAEAQAVSSFAATALADNRQEQADVQDDDQPECPEAISSGCFKSSIRVSGKLTDVKLACKSLQKHGFFKHCSDDKFPLNGHWETDHGMSVAIEGKLVRWSQKRASRLKFHGSQNRLCSLSLYGENATGQLVLPIAPETRKMVQWSNGDVWHSQDACRLGETLLLSQSMTKVQRDASQDEKARCETAAALRLVSKSGLSLLPDCLMHVEQFIGSTTYYFDVEFESKEWNPWMLLDFSTALGDGLPHLEVSHRWGNAH